jgi:uncharacterized membrane protein YfcA
MVSPLTAVAAVLVGVLVGLTGIGGVFLVPWLLVVEGRPVHQVVGTLLLSFAGAQTVGVGLYARRGAIDWPTTLWLCAGAVPGAPVGAALSTVLPAGGLRLLLAGFLVLAGGRILYDARHPPAAPPAERPQLPRQLLVPLGALIGLAAGLLGVGGPIVLGPVLLLLGTPAATAVGINQVIGLVGSAAGAVGHCWLGTVDVSLALALTACLLVGIAVGAQLARWLRPARWRGLLGLGCLALAPLVAWPGG